MDISLMHPDLKVGLGKILGEIYAIKRIVGLPGADLATIYALRNGILPVIDKELALWFWSADVEDAKRTTISTRDDNDFDAVLFPFEQNPEAYPGYESLKKSLRDRGIDESKEFVLFQWYRLRSAFPKLFGRLVNDNWTPSFLKSLRDETTEALRSEGGDSPSDLA